MNRLLPELINIIFQYYNDGNPCLLLMLKHVNRRFKSVIENYYRKLPRLKFYPCCPPSFDLLKWFHKNDFKINERTAISAVKIGDIEMLKYLIKIKSTTVISTDLIYVAIYNDHLDVMKFLLDNYNYDIGDLLTFLTEKPEIFRWLLDYCKVIFIPEKNAWSDHLYRNVLSNSDDTLFYELKNRGCVPGPMAFNFAAAHCDVTIVEMLFEMKCEYNSYELYKSVFTNRNDVMFLQLLRDKDVPLHSKLYSIVIEYDCMEEGLQWLAENKCPYNQSLFRLAVRMENFNVLEFLYENMPHPTITEFTVDEEWENDEIEQWLNDRGINLLHH